MGKGLDPVGDSLRRLAKLRNGPVGRVALGDIVGPGVVDQPLGERGWQHEIALGHGDEAVAQAVEPELGAAALADAGVEMMRVLDVAGGTGGRGEHPVANVLGIVAASPSRRSRMAASCRVTGSSRGTPVLVFSTRNTSPSMSTRSQRRVSTSSRRMPV